MRAERIIFCAAAMLLSAAPCAAQGKEYPLLVVPVAQVRAFSTYGTGRVVDPKMAKRGPDGLIYISEEGGRFHRLDGDGTYLDTLVIRPMRGTPARTEPYDFDFSRDGETVVFGDFNTGWVFGMDLKGRIAWQTKLRYPDEKENLDARATVPEAFLKSGRCGVGGIAVRPDDILAADTFGRLIHRLDGETRDEVEWLTAFPHNGGDPVLFDRIDRFLRLPDGSFLVEQPVARELDRVGGDDLALIYSVGLGLEAKTGGFVGPSGFDVLGDGKRFMATDSALHSIQVFDLAAGDYLFSYGMEEARRDPDAPYRPTVDWQSPRLPVVLNNGDFMIYQGLRRVWSVYHPTADAPVRVE